jgi:hypothetical protein
MPQPLPYCSTIGLDRPCGRQKNPPEKAGKTSNHFIMIALIIRTHFKTISWNALATDFSKTVGLCRLAPSG